MHVLPALRRTGGGGAQAGLYLDACLPVRGIPQHHDKLGMRSNHVHPVRRYRGKDVPRARLYENSPAHRRYLLVSYRLSRWLPLLQKRSWKKSTRNTQEFLGFLGDFPYCNIKTSKKATINTQETQGRVWLYPRNRVSRQEEPFIHSWMGNIMQCMYLDLHGLATTSRTCKRRTAVKRSLHFQPWQHCGSPYIPVRPRGVLLHHSSTTRWRNHESAQMNRNQP